MPSPSPEQLRQMREMAVAAGNQADVATIDAELSKVQPLDDLSPLREAYADRQAAAAQGAPPELLRAIDARIHDFTSKMKSADVQRTLESMGAGGRFLAGAGAGLENVGQHAKDLAHEIFPLENDYETRQFQADRKAEMAQFRQENAPLVSNPAGYFGNLTGEVAGTAPIAAVAGPGVAGSALAGAGTGVLMSEPGERLQGAAVGGLAGLGLGLAGRAAASPIRSRVEVSPAAQQLRDLGVEGITAGQAAPKSAIAHIEQAGESGPLGASIKAAREELPLNLEQKALELSAPPGFQVPPRGAADFAERIAAVQDEYGKRYGVLLDQGPVPKNSIQYDLLKRAMNGEGRVLSGSELKQGSDYVADRLSKLESDNTLSTLGDIRSDFRAKSAALRNSNPELAGYFNDMKQAVDEHIAGAMKANPNAGAYGEYQALNRQYRNYKILEKAAKMRGDSASGVQVTPDKLSQALASDMTPGQFVRGGGGDLRILAKAGKQVLSPPRPTTGALLGVLNTFPGSNYVRAAQGYASSHFPSFYLGETLPQRVLQKALQPSVRGAIGQSARVGLLDELLAPKDEFEPPETYVESAPVAEAPKKRKK